MDVTAILTIILSIIGINMVFFIYLINRMDSGFRDLQKEINDLKAEILWIKFRLDPHEHHPKKDDQAKEN